MGAIIGQAVDSWSHGLTAHGHVEGVTLGGRRATALHVAMGSSEVAVEQEGVTYLLHGEPLRPETCDRGRGRHARVAATSGQP